LGINWLWRRRGAVASGATLTAAAVIISTLAALHPGIPTADLELDDGGVWVTKTSDLLVGHLNYPSRLLDGALRTRAADFDILQDGDTVGVVDAVNSTLTLVDPASVALGNDTTLPEKSAVALGGTTFAVLAGGHVYTVPSTSLTGTTFDADAATADIGDGGAVAVSRSGAHIVAVSARDAALLTIDSATGEARSQALPKLADDAALEATAVGEQGVALATASGTLYTPGGTAVELPDGQGARLQEAGADADSVYVATPTALLREPLGGGTPETVATVAKGVPSAPVVVGGCAYAVWSGTGAYVRDCPGTADDVQLTIETTPDAHLVLRANRRVVVVNDTVAGTVWAVEQNALRIENWDEVVPPASDDAQEEQSQDEKPQFDLPERSAQNTPPTAVDDQYGVRAGRTTILRVTENDTDPDGDLLSASLVSDPPSGWDVQPVLGGAALQASVPANASGATALRYRVDDGRGGAAEATATVTVRPPEVNEPPVQKRIDTVLVEAGASLTYGVLDAWSDPDGDDVFLQNATVEGGDQVTFRSNGVLEYTAATAQTGIHEVKLVVSDGRETTEGVLRVDVRPVDSLNPVANADRVTAVAGVAVTVAPLDNDLSPTGRALRLSKHDTVPGATITPDFTAETFDFVAEQPGTYYVQYLVTDGPHSAVGIVRIDVVAAGASPLPPVAVRDLALLPTGRSTLVDVLANDVDPAGGILVVQTAHVPATAGVSVEVLENRILRVTDLSGLSGPVTLTYTVSNGTQSATGEVLVMPVPLPAQLRPPVTVDDTAVVRVGDVVSVSVLANDYSPDNDTLRLEPTLVETDAPDKDAIFVDGDRIRFQAGAEPGTVHATYEVSDSQQNRTAGYLTIQVLPADQGSNSAPRPKPVTARVIAGNTVRIAIPLTGIDTDGDSVELVGVASNPQKGTVTTGDSWFVYEAYPDATGRDTFTYTVRDRLGAEAQSTVVVGVAAPGYDNQAPYAVKDTVTVKPGRRVAVPVTANDSDPDGDPISIDPNGLTVPEGVDAEILGGRVVVTAPGTPGQYTFSYTIADSYGATAVGALLVTVEPNAPAVAPIARDDRVPSGRITSAPTVDVNVLENDEDPDGTVEDLRVTTSDSTVTVGASGILTVTLQPTPQIIRYRVEDADAQMAQAFVFVPGLDALVPTLATTEPITVTSGEAVRIELADRVHVRPEREPRIATADSVRAGHADGSPMIIDEHTLEYRSAAGFFGRDSLGVLVTDGTGPDDPQGLSGYVSIPITVVPAQNQSPIMRNASVQVAPGESSQKLDLGRLTRDPDEGDEEKLSFSIDGDAPAGFRASISGRTLEVSADADLEAGATGTVRVLASDGTSAPGAGSIALTAVVSQRPFPVANDDVIARADQGRTTSVDALANDINPFADKGPLELISARVDSGQGTAVVNGSRVDVTPAADFVGTMVVSYRIGDATKSAERQVDGRILLTVQGRPGAPGTPTVTSIQDRTVVLSWSTPTNNGSPITGYKVSSPQGYSKTCASTTCTLDGLTNDVEYTFTVVATNEVGDSDPSPSSAPARPDARPDTPASPTTVFGDRSLTVTWSAPRSTGSPVTSYNLEISPAPATGPIQRTGVGGTSIVWDGLQNGVAYQVRVQAVNRAPDPSEWSPYSAAVVPAGVPSAPGTPTTTPATPVGAQAQIGVSWATPADENGDRVSGYTLTVKRGGTVVNTIPTTATSQNVVVETSETDYSFSVTARNKAGDSAASADSAPRRGAVAPGAPANVVLTPRDQSVGVEITPGPLNGSRSSEIVYHYRVDQTGAQGTLPPSGGSIGGLANGATYTVSVWATSSVQGVSPGAETRSNEAVPFGKPILTFNEVNRQDHAVQFVWTVNANGRPITGTNAPVGGEGRLSWTKDGLQPSEAYTLNLSYTNEAGTTSDSRTGQANDPPPKGMTISQPNGGIGVRLVVQGFEPNRTLSVACWVTPRADGQEGRSIGSFSVTTDASGAGDWNWPSTCQMTGGGYGNLRVGNEIWSNTIKLN
jgi:hypothetical protein